MPGFLEPEGRGGPYGAQRGHRPWSPTPSGGSRTLIGPVTAVTAIPNSTSIAVSCNNQTASLTGMGINRPHTDRRYRPPP